MKKVILGFLSIILLGQMAQAQPVLDQAVIPMAITVNSILRMNIVSGGNIEFVFNTLDDYTNGIGASLDARYATNVTIASSTNWHLQIYSSSGTFVGDGGTIALNFVGYTVVNNGGANTVAVGGVDIDFVPTGVAYSVLTNAAYTFLQAGANGNTGGVADNNFLINWECATAVGAADGVSAPISNSLALSGRYSTNVLLALLPN